MAVKQQLTKVVTVL